MMKWEKITLSLIKIKKVLTKAQMYEYVKKTVKRYGLERTEEIIKEVYKTVPGLQEQILAMLYEVWKGL